MILIFYALRRELAHVRKRIGDRVALSGGLRGFRGRLGGEEVALVATGIGVGQAREAARRALQMLPQARLVISTGVAGGLTPELRAGDLVIADPLLLESEGEGAFEEVARVAPDTMRFVQGAFGRRGLTASCGPMLTMLRLVPTVAGKHAAYARSGAIAADMESAAIAVEMASCGVPFVCVRAIIDEAADEIPGAELVDDSGEVAPLKAAAYFLANPAALMRVPAILKKMSRATASIASALEALCPAPGG
jgi:adenosylhomocysteine nucleosidase